MAIQDNGQCFDLQKATPLVYCLRKSFTHFVIPDLIRNPVFSVWIPAFAGMTRPRTIFMQLSISPGTTVKNIDIHESQ